MSNELQKIQIFFNYKQKKNQIFVFKQKKSNNCGFFSRFYVWYGRRKTKYNSKILH